MVEARAWPATRRSAGALRLCALVIGAGLLAGCGKSADEAARQDQPQLPPPQVPATEPATPTRLTADVGPSMHGVTSSDPDTIKVAIAKYRSQVKSCYERRLMTNTTLAGRVDLRWQVEAGRVTSVEVLTNSTGDDDLAECIVQKIRRWRFPAETSTEIDYPFIFSVE